MKLNIFAYTESENMKLEPFKARFAPRSEKIHRLVVQEAKKARERQRRSMMGRRGSRWRMLRAIPLGFRISGCGIICISK